MSDVLIRIGFTLGVFGLALALISLVWSVK